METREAAFSYHREGLNVIPITRDGGRKKPLSNWQHWQGELQTASDVRNMFPDDNRNIGIVGGAPSGNFATLDFDNRTTYRYLLERNRRLQQIADQTPVVRTDRGVHLYIRTPEPVASTKNTELCLDVKASGGYVVAPPSLHRSGQLYLFEKGFGKIIQLSTLDELGFVKFQAVGYERRERFGLGRYWYVLQGHLLGYASRSEAEQALITVCVRNGWTFDAVYELFRRFASEATHYAEKAPRYQYGYLQASYNGASEYIAANRREIDRTIDAMRRSVDRLDLGRTRHIDKAILHAALSVARRTGRLTGLHLSARELAELSGVRRETVRKAMQRIPGLEIVEKSDGYTPNLFNLNIEPVSFVAIPSHTVCEGMGFNDTHDAFRHRALGKIGYQVLVSVVRQPQKAEDIAKSIKSGKKTIYRKLNQLCRFGVAWSESGVWHAKKPTQQQLDNIAERLGTAGAAERQKREHDEDRRQQRRAREAYRASKNEDIA